MTKCSTSSLSFTKLYVTKSFAICNSIIIQILRNPPKLFLQFLLHNRDVTQPLDHATLSITIIFIRTPVVYMYLLFVIHYINALFNAYLGTYPLVSLYLLVPLFFGHRTFSVESPLLKINYHSFDD